MLTIISIIFFITFFSFHKITEPAEPLFEPDDLILISRIPEKNYSHGEKVLIKNDGKLIAKRIISVPGEKAEYINSRFSVDGSELLLSIFSENELRRMPISSYDVVSEINGNYKYPVKQRKGKSGIKINLQQDQYLTSSDDREKENFYTLVNRENIAGRVEGSLISLSRKKILIKPFVSAAE